MASRFEPFLINPPKRLSGMRRRFRMNMTDPHGYAEGDPALQGLPSKKTIQARAAAYARWAKKAKKKSTKRRKKVAKKVVVRRRTKRVAKKVVRRRRSGISHAAAVKRAKKAARTRAMKGKRPMARKRSRKRVSSRRRSYVRHAKLRSQWWKQRRRTKRKGYAKKHKRHMVVAYKHRGHLYTSPFAKKVWPNHRLNPFGADLMTIGANPRRRSRRRSRKRYSMNPRRRRYMARGRRRFSSNPLSSIGHLMPMIAAGTAGALATKMIPRIVGVNTPWAVYGTQAVVIFGGGFLADKFMGKSVSDGWVIGGASMILTNLVGGMLGGVFAGLGLDYEAFPNEVGAFPMGMLGDGMGQVDLGANEFEPSMVY